MPTDEQRARWREAKAAQRARAREESPPARPRGRPRTHASPAEGARVRKRRQRERSLVGYQKEIVEDMVKSIVKIHETDPPAAGVAALAAVLAAPRAEAAFSRARSPEATASQIGEEAEKVRLAISLSADRLAEPGPADPFARCRKCGEPLSSAKESFRAGEARFVSCALCSTVNYYGEAVLTPDEEAQLLGVRIPIGTTDEPGDSDESPPAHTAGARRLALGTVVRGSQVSRLFGVEREPAGQIDVKLGMGGTPGSDRDYRGQIAEVLGHPVEWDDYNDHFRPRKTAARPADEPAPTAQSSDPYAHPEVWEREEPWYEAVRGDRQRRLTAIYRRLSSRPGEAYATEERRT